MSLLYFLPIPLQALHDPYDVLNENNLGSISYILKPVSGGAKCSEKTSI